MKRKAPFTASFRDLRFKRDSIERYWVYLLGLIGWIIILYNAPFGWSAPNYAAF